MAFSDRDIEELKRIGESTHAKLTSISHERLLALIARLEAAEDLITTLGDDPLSGKVGKAYEAWRKGAGK